MSSRVCDWCGKPLSDWKRRHALTCSKKCRQQRARFRVAPADSSLDVSRCNTASPSVAEGLGDRSTTLPQTVALSSAAAGDASLQAAATLGRFDVSRADLAGPIRVAYADPPYPGCAQRYYGKPEIDHYQLIAHLCAHSDAWALSTSAKALPDVLRLCPPGVRVAAWLRAPFHNVSWEPVILFGGRKVPRESAVPDALICKDRQRGFPGALVGMKPPAFAEWVFRLLGARKGDEFADVFPGSTAITRAWQLFTGQRQQRTAKPSRLELALRAPYVSLAPGSGSSAAGDTSGEASPGSSVEVSPGAGSGPVRRIGG